jgi:hypothetical protein
MALTVDDFNRDHTRGQGTVRSSRGIQEGRVQRIALLALIFVAAGLSAQAQASSAKGSSCQHPYRAHWIVPRSASGEYNSRMFGPAVGGDIHYIKIRGEYRTLGTEVGYFNASWRPGVKHLHLKVCWARLTFDYRKSITLHYWQPTPLEIQYNPEHEKRHVTSFVVTAAR